jgi:hypothetical protein
MKPRQFVQWIPAFAGMTALRMGVASPEDVFFIPVEITAPSLIIRRMMSDDEYSQLMSRLRASSDEYLRNPGFGEIGYLHLINSILRRVESYK